MTSIVLAKKELSPSRKQGRVPWSIEKWLAGHEVDAKIASSRKPKHIDGVRHSEVQKTSEPQGKHIVSHP
jgi:hypothetical protein